jgi:hypothetical protein
MQTDQTSAMCGRRYLDYIASTEGLPHDQYFCSYMLKHLVEKSGYFLKADGSLLKDSLIILCDNGMMSHEFVYTATKLSEMYGLVIQFLCLCARHGWSLCDPHGGKVRGILTRELAKVSACGCLVVVVPDLLTHVVLSLGLVSNWRRTEGHCAEHFKEHNRYQPQQQITVRRTCKRIYDP